MTAHSSDHYCLSFASFFLSSYSEFFILHLRLINRIIMQRPDLFRGAYNSWSEMHPRGTSQCVNCVVVKASLNTYEMPCYYFQDNSPGQEILDTVFRHLNLLETAYFGLRYLDASSQTVRCSVL